LSLIIVDKLNLLDVLKALKITSTNEIGTSESTGEKGVNESKQLIDNKGRKYLWKNRSGEHTSSWRFVPPHQLYLREKAAYIVDRLLGFNMVPKVRIAKYEGDVGSLQNWIEDTSPADATLRTYSEDDIWKAGLFDIIIGNTDRHSGNFLTKLNKPILIDNGFAFPSYATQESKRSLILSRFAYAIFDKPIPEKFYYAIEKLNDESVKKRLSKYLGPKTLGLMYERINEMLKRKRASCHKYKIIKKLDHVPKDEIKANIVKNIARLRGNNVYYL
jgi:hypothetical protein